MSTPIADEFEEIARRQAEIAEETTRAEQVAAARGSVALDPGELTPNEIRYIERGTRIDLAG